MSKTKNSLLEKLLSPQYYVEEDIINLSVEDLLNTNDELLKNITVPAIEVKRLLKHVQENGI